MYVWCIYLWCVCIYSYVCMVYMCGMCVLCIYVVYMCECLWYMYVCICLYMHTHTCMCSTCICSQVHMWMRPEVNVGYFLNSSPLYFRGQGFSVNLEFIDWLAWPCRELCPVSVSLGLELQACASVSGFHEDAEVELRLSCIHSKHFTHWVPLATSLKNDVTPTVMAL